MKMKNGLGNSLRQDFLPSSDAFSTGNVILFIGLTCKQAGMITVIVLTAQLQGAKHIVKAYYVIIVLSSACAMDADRSALADYNSRPEKT